jgi:hypothetical protein
VDDALPLVTAALICERVLVEKDEVVSAIRVFDRVFYQVSPPPGQTGIVCTFLVVLKRGKASQDRYELRVIIRLPSGRESEPMKDIPITVEFPATEEDSGINLHIGFMLTPSEEGLHWIELLSGDRVLARTPLRLIQRPSD